MSKSIHQEYTDCDNDRAGKVEKSRAYSRATINTLLPDSDNERRSVNQMKHPHSSLPARGLTEWAGKMTTALLPIAGVPFLSIELPPITKYKSSPEELRSFSEITKVIQDVVHYELSQSNAREVLNVGMQHVGAIGDVLIKQDGLKFSYFRVDNYIVKRDTNGDPIHIMIRKFSRELELTDEQKKTVEEDRVDPLMRGLEKFYPYYVDLRLDGDTWTEKHYLGNTFIEGTDKTYTKDLFPYYALRYKYDPYEDWSTSLVEENYGDIIASHATRETLLEGLAISNMGYTGFDPSLITPNVLKNTRNWGYVPLKGPNAVSYVQPNNIQSLSVSSEFNNTISVDIRRIFLMDVASEFTHDRVTAFQISQANQALERASGGSLSSFKNDFLVRMGRVTVDYLVKENKLPELAQQYIKDGEMDIIIKSGIDSIRTDTEDQMVFQFFLEMVQAAPDTLKEFNVSALLAWRAKQRGIPQEILMDQASKDAEAEQELSSQVQDQLVQGVAPATQGLVEGMINQ